MAAKLNPPFSCASACLSSPSQRKAKLKLSSRPGLFDSLHDTEISSNIKVNKSCKLRHGESTMKETLSKKKCILFAKSECRESFSELEPEELELENEDTPDEISTPTNITYYHTEGADGKPGFVSFYQPIPKREDEVLVSSSSTNQRSLLWLVGPTILVASFVFPSIYLRKILSALFEDSLLTDFLILFFTEALFYCGVAVFLLLMDHLRRPKESTYAQINQNLVPHLGHRISSVAVLVLSLMIPMVTMGFVWPWTGPAASATLAPYLVGIFVQFAFEQYARITASPSWPAIPIIFQVYRLHQLNRAAQLVTALSFTVRGAEMTPHNIAINGSLSTLLNVLQFLGVICIWSLSSFIIRYFPSATTPQQNMTPER